MINEARTLLLNRDGSSRPPPTYFLEEYVDPAFKALTLPAELQSVYETLIGGLADNAYANFRLRQYTTVLHSTEFAAYVTALDSRVTYLGDRTAVDTLFSSSSAPLNAPASLIPVAFSGQPASPTGSRRVEYDWTIETLSPLLVRTSLAGTHLIRDTSIVIISGLTNPIELAGQTSLFVYLSAAALPVGALWSATAMSKPQDDLATLVVALEKLSASVLTRLFEGGEPYSTFKELWEKHAYIQYRLSGLLLAFVYKAEEVRQRGQ